MILVWVARHFQKTFRKGTPSSCWSSCNATDTKEPPALERKSRIRSKPSNSPTAPSRSIDRSMCARAVRNPDLPGPSGGAPHRGGVGSMMNGWLEGRSRSRSRSAIDRRKHPCRRWSILIRSDPPSARGSPRGPGGQRRYDREFALGKRKTGTSSVPKSGGKVAVRALSGLITELLLVFRVYSSDDNDSYTRAASY